MGDVKPARFEECILCGSTTRAKSKEDVLPNWIRNFAASQGDAPFVGYKRGRPYEGKRPPAIVTRAVCIQCNAWMNGKFEIPAKPILVRLFRGTPQRLSHAEQGIIACWIAKSVLMRAASDFTPSDLMPLSEYRRFREAAAPAENTRVLLGAMADPGQALPIGPPPGLPSKASPTGSVPAGAMWAAYRSDIVIGYLVMQYVQVFDHNVYRSTAEVGGLLVPIWPLPGRTVEWPPAHFVTPENSHMLEKIAVV